MSEIARRLNQCRKPSGETGKMVADDMNERHFAVTGWGLDKINIDENLRIIDTGCGGGRTVNRLASMSPKGKVIGIDYSKDCVKWSKEFNKQLIEEGRVEIYNASVEKLPFKDSEFDMATAVETIYFWPNIVESFKEIKRILKPTGKFIVINEIYMDEKHREEYSQYEDKMNVYTPDELKQIFLDAGYSHIDLGVEEDKNWMYCIGKA
ncbi:class I SAM-dependent methyltransferase [Clostridium tyrobutyricum]|jgi:Methylase involved in ubiquinone/menaquinone biosynthesis|uniref:class I SAM-dependent methyltransferase n=1 Tax=Clostridium tyrobutyricum TaxID=1519 RepID=UPI0002D5AD81|nr:class I SAM-dependent methyltransferase [Clostridium tyrobutyricum]MBV4424999.1 class I SAM-dependent methyltransferase [Clostridium tyrobutyricum]MBV4430091.1 class I SAM-dependent methyltransferase [Clostridium tyrobutyricum]MBV4439647.1 class I SAM-dependent methyltransferase [Clostridium tyrobutyricum]MEA5008825.1 class I SAM-dependent methyltransferase [Clostridium tyrobutyricum]